PARWTPRVAAANRRDRGLCMTNENASQPNRKRKSAPVALTSRSCLAGRAWLVVPGWSCLAGRAWPLARGRSRVAARAWPLARGRSRLAGPGRRGLVEPVHDACHVALGCADRLVLDRQFRVGTRRTRRVTRGGPLRHHRDRVVEIQSGPVGPAGLLDPDRQLLRRPLQ